MKKDLVIIGQQHKRIISTLGLFAMTVGIILAWQIAPAIAQGENTSLAKSVVYPVVTAITAGILAILQSLLMLTVGLKRVQYSQGIGDGGHEDLARIMRRHGNLVENAPIFLVVLALLEMTGFNRLFVIVVASLFIVARFSHAIAFSITTGPHPLRVVGAFGTVLSIIVSSGFLMWRVF